MTLSEVMSQPSLAGTTDIEPAAHVGAQLFTSVRDHSEGTIEPLKSD
jgi:hypothetical protein